MSGRKRTKSTELINLRIPVDMVARIRQRAKTEGVTQTAQVVTALNWWEASKISDGIGDASAAMEFVEALTTAAGGLNQAMAILDITRAAQSACAAGMSQDKAVAEMRRALRVVMRANG